LGISSDAQVTRVCEKVMGPEEKSGAAKWPVKGVGGGRCVCEGGVRGWECVSCQGESK